jgi:energy-coupling factor transport system permease protein
MDGGAPARGGRRVRRTRYRPDPWGRPEWLVAGCGLVAGTGLVAAAALQPAAFTPNALTVPPLPPAALACVLLAAAPAVLGRGDR